MAETEEDTPILAVEDVHAGYGSRLALKGVGVHIGKSEIVALIGSNGAGKSTLLMTICGYPRPSRGRVLFEG